AGVPADVTVECDAVPAPASPTATDNCDTDVEIAFTEVRTDGDCPDSYTLTRTWTATDNCGNQTTQSQTITVQDTEAPVLAGVPADVTVECDAVPAPASPTATDNCDADVEITFTEVRTDGDCPDSYTLTRTWTATDNCGNSSSLSQTITVQDTEAPVLAGVPADVTVQCDAVPAPDTPTATDNCDADVEIAFTEVRTDGDCLDSYTLTRTWTASDNCGNQTTQSQVITVQDTQAPVLAGVPADVTVECDSVPAPASPTATDNCDVDVEIAFTEVRTDGDCPDSYTLTRTWTATDNCGNSSSHTQTITVQDTEAPVLAGVPSDITVQCDAVPAPSTPTAT
ncbi:MAG: gliding motility-associated C-terminal domain-containing protein, partial [Alphaproteobacteria bacterium]